MSGKKRTLSSVLASRFRKNRGSDASMNPLPDSPGPSNAAGSAADPIAIDSDSGDSDVQYFDGDPFEVDDEDEDGDLQAAIAASLEESRRAEREVTQAAPVKNAATRGREGWIADAERCRASLGAEGEVEGYAGMVGKVLNIQPGQSQDSITFGLQYEDIDGRENKLNLEMSFRDLNTYPASYTASIFSHDKLPRRAAQSFLRFVDCYDLDLPRLIGRLVASLQGDDEATGGEPRDESDEDEDAGEEEEAWMDETERELMKGHQGGDVPAGWTMLKTHFEQALQYGFRPGLTRVSDFWVISYSIPLKNIAIDPNTLAMWDDDLVAAWHDNQRFQLLMGVEEYPPKPDNIRYWLSLHKDYKPPLDIMIQTTRGNGLHFYLSAPLASFLRAFPRCFALRTTYNLDWATADRTGIDENIYQAFVRTTRPVKARVQAEKDDPVAKGWAGNVPLCAFYWVLRRFVEAPRYCLNCGLEVETTSLRPYVCAKPLCLYGFLSLRLGPSVEHTIQTHPGVVDLLLSFAHCAASGSTRMDMPTHLHIELPPEFGFSKSTILFDELPNPAPTAGRAAPPPDPSTQPFTQRRALFWLLSKLPRVSVIKTFLDSGGKLNQLSCPSGSIGVLRWVVGSCRAYLKEVKPGEGVVNDNISTANAYGAGQAGQPAVRQFLFVVGSPEQEANFRGEIVKAQKEQANCKKYPTLLAFHGSAADRWHNILRTGLDFEEVANARAYGHGVYFAHEASTSMSTYAVGSTVFRPNADFGLAKATALVELVNVPCTFVSSSPYYVVNNTKQIKPFLLIVNGAIPDPIPPEGADGPGAAADMVAGAVYAQTVAQKEAQARVKAQPGLVFQHDPKLPMKTSFWGKPLQVMMPAKLKPSRLKDTSPNDATDHKILHPPPPPAPVKVWEPTLHARLRGIPIMPPPVENSVVASKALGKEFKALVKAQAEGKLPFYVDPEGDSLYSWLLELHDFPASELKNDLAKHKIPSIIAEIRFPASFPHAPPFMRIIHPRCMPFTQGGGGNITGGGSVCNEILTASGWNPAFCVEAIVRDIMVNMTEATPPAKLHPSHWNSAYTMQEAVAAYVRVAQAHGWEVPKDFQKVASGVIATNWDV
ncbi:hypothetical protein IAT38_002220 [Cryptococcus sp. DSM 104549]